jgi:hypothetical protein
MLKFFKNLHSSGKFMDRLALEIGVEKKLFKAALTDLGINFSQIEQDFEQVALDGRKLGFSEEVIMQRACMGIISYARLGGAQLIIRFGEQPSIEAFMFAMIDYQEAHIDVVDDPAAYRRERMYQ